MDTETITAIAALWRLAAAVVLCLFIIALFVLALVFRKEVKSVLQELYLKFRWGEKELELRKQQQLAQQDQPSIEETEETKETVTAEN